MVAASRSRTANIRTEVFAAFPLVMKAERLKRGWTQQEMSEFCDVSQSLVNRWESGSRSPSIPELTRIGHLLRITWTLG